VLGLDLDGPAGAAPAHELDAEVNAEVVALLEQRAEARAAPDFETADTLRARLVDLGYVVTDGPTGQRISRSRDPGGARSGR
ncbi:MAG: hypothetical protein QOE42_592, partial [Chloroflexota bacterium]|nr:hypothetical protein [Chloroflexota bacterium]